MMNLFGDNFITCKLGVFTLFGMNSLFSWCFSPKIGGIWKNVAMVVFFLRRFVPLANWVLFFVFWGFLQVDPSKRPLPDYVQKVQRDVNANMRGVLVDWLVEVAEEYTLVSDTLYFSVSYIDRFLSLNALSRQKLQLLGVSSMLIAS